MLLSVYTVATDTRYRGHIHTVATHVLSFGSIGQEVRSLYIKNKALIRR